MSSKTNCPQCGTWKVGFKFQKGQHPSEVEWFCTVCSHVWKRPAPIPEQNGKRPRRDSNPDDDPV